MTRYLRRNLASTGRRTFKTALLQFEAQTEGRLPHTIPRRLSLHRQRPVHTQHCGVTREALTERKLPHPKLKPDSHMVFLGRLSLYGQRPVFRMEIKVGVILPTSLLNVIRGIELGSMFFDIM